MPYCTGCGGQITEGARFCPTCGASSVLPPPNTNPERQTPGKSRTITCPYCHRVTPAKADECAHCQANLKAMRRSCLGVSIIATPCLILFAVFAAVVIFITVMLIIGVWQA